MILDIREFETFPAHKILESGPGQLTVDFEGIKRIEKVVLDLTIQQSGEEYYCQGKVKADVALECARCLREFSGELVSDTDFIVCSKEIHENREDAIDTEDYAFFEGGDLQADVSDIVRQAIILALTIKPLCSEDCKGFCPTCGENRNEKSCDCKNERIDPRWEGLKNLSGFQQENRGSK